MHRVHRVGERRADARDIFGREGARVTMFARLWPSTHSITK